MVGRTARWAKCRNGLRFLGAVILVAALPLTACSAAQLDTLSAWKHRMTGHTVTYDGSWSGMAGPSAVWHIVERNGQIVSATTLTNGPDGTQPFSLMEAINQADGADRADVSDTIDSLHFFVDPDTDSTDDQYSYAADHIVITP